MVAPQLPGFAPPTPPAAAAPSGLAYGVHGNGNLLGRKPQVTVAMVVRRSAKSYEVILSDGRKVDFTVGGPIDIGPLTAKTAYRDMADSKGVQNMRELYHRGHLPEDLHRAIQTPGARNAHQAGLTAHPQAPGNAFRPPAPPAMPPPGPGGPQIPGLALPPPPPTGPGMPPGMPPG